MRFRGNYLFLSNMYATPVKYHGITYPSAENAFQAQKAPINLRACFANISPKQAKAFGRQMPLPENWDIYKLQIMHEICYNKFAENTELKDKLLETKDIELIEDNTWNDTYWGVCNGKGENNLGKILMYVRNELSNI